jgi:Tol biopolymer transport system component
VIALGAIVVVILAVKDQRVAALAINGKIAFVSSDQTIYTVNPDGLGLVRLTPSETGARDRGPDWSPDGTKIVFSRQTFTHQSQIYVMNADGTNPIRITNNTAEERDPAWSPDGTKIAFVSARDGNNEIYVMNADGSNQTRLTNDPGFDTEPAWSPDGTKIAFSTSRDFPGSSGNFAGAIEIYTMNADGSNPVRLTNNLAVDAAPSWSPDGTKIVFNTQRDGLVLVYVMNANGSNPVNITQSTTLDSLDGEWSPDGTTIAFTSFGRTGISNASEIFLMNADGSNIRPLTNSSLDEHELAWQPLASVPTPTPTPPPTPTPSPIPTFKMSGTVTDNKGQPLAGVTMILVSQMQSTQVVFTNQTGNY